MRRVHLVLAGVVATVVLVGYLEGRPGLEDVSDEQRDESAGDLSERVHIAYWEKWRSFEGEAAQAMTDHFNEIQNRIFVHRIPTSEVDRKSMLAVIGGDPPDVVGLWDRNVSPFADGNALLPLDDLMAESGLTPDYYHANYLELCRYRGKTYALPTTPATIALFWNKEHFRRKADQLRAAGLEPDRAPRTIRELDRYAEVLSEFKPDGTPKVMGFLPTEPGWFNSTWGYFFGGTLYDEATGQITADHPANVRAYTWLKRFAEAYGREKLLQFRQGFGTFDSPQNGFIDGRVSMVLQGVWFPNFIRRHRPHMDFGVAPFPVPEGVGYPRSLMECDVIAIPRGCKHPREAWEFILYTQTGGGMEILCRHQGKHLPFARTPAYFHQGHPNPFLEVFEELAASPHSFITPRITVWVEYREEMEDAFDHIWSWPVPADQLEGLTGQARQAKIDELCRGEVQRTLRQVKRRMQERLDKRRMRDAQRARRQER